MNIMLSKRSTPFLLLLLTGLILAFFPDIIVRIFVLSGVGVITYSIIEFLVYKIKKLPYPVYRLVFGIIAGSIIIALPPFAELAIPVIVGAFVLINGFERIASSLSMKKTKKSWWISFIIGAAFFAAGLYTLLNPVQIMDGFTRTLGFMLIVISVYRLAAVIGGGNGNNDDKPPKVINADYKVK